MKIAISGKGGVGKTTIAGTLVRLFADRGYSVIAVDADPSMNLHTMIGVENPVPISKLKQLIGERTVITPGIYNLNPRVDDVVEKYCAVRDNIRLIVMGTVEGVSQGCMCPENAFLRALLRHLVLKRGEMVILDSEAGVEHMARNIAEGFDLMLVVAEPSRKAVDVANRLIELSRSAGIPEVYCVANRVASLEDEDFLKENLIAEVLESIPEDELVRKAERQGIPLADLQEESEALQKIFSLSEKIEKITGKLF